MVDALLGRSKTRSVTAVAPPPSAQDKALIEALRSRRTRGVTVEERKAIAVLSDALPSVDVEVRFEYNSAVVTSAAEPALAQLGRVLSNPRLAGLAFLVCGHTDAVGGADFNLVLSQRRAEAVKKHLIERYRIAEERLVTVGHGFEQLKDRANPKAAANRRVQIVNLGAGTRTDASATPTPVIVPVASPGSSPAPSPQTAAKTRSMIDKSLADIMGTGELPAAPAMSAVTSGPLTVRLSPGTDLKIGDLMTVSVTSTLAGTLIVYEQDAAGQTTQIFPNNFSGSPQTTIAAGETIMIPGPTSRFQLRVTPPVGASRIIAVVIPTRVEVSDITRHGADMKPLPNAMEVIGKIAERVTRGVKVEPAERAVGIAEYVIRQ
jgi:outer membrane protein OmpA-like peptidoglycan-associated protein